MSVKSSLIRLKAIFRRADIMTKKQTEIAINLVQSVTWRSPSVLSSAPCSPLCTRADLRPQSFLPVKGASDRGSGLRRNMPRRCCPASHPAHPPFQNHLDHREWINHIRGPEERWEVDSTVTAGVALARLIPLGRGKRGTPSRLRGRERKNIFPGMSSPVW